MIGCLAPFNNAALEEISAVLSTLLSELLAVIGQLSCTDADITSKGTSINTGLGRWLLKILNAWAINPGI